MVLRPLKPLWNRTKQASLRRRVATEASPASSALLRAPGARDRRIKPGADVVVSFRRDGHIGSVKALEAFASIAVLLSEKSEILLSTLLVRPVAPSMPPTIAPSGPPVMRCRAQ